MLAGQPHDLIVFFSRWREKVDSFEHLRGNLEPIGRLPVQM
jgi:hypothetical protein